MTDDGTANSGFTPSSTTMTQPLNTVPITLYYLVSNSDSTAYVSLDAEGSSVNKFKQEDEDIDLLGNPDLQPCLRNGYEDLVNDIRRLPIFSTKFLVFFYQGGIVTDNGIIKPVVY